MRKKITKTVALALAGTMVLGSFAGCGDKETKTNNESKSESKSEKESESKDDSKSHSDAVGMDSWEAFDDKVTITVPVYDRSKDGYPAVDDNYWTDWVQTEFGDKYNIDVQYVAIPRSDVMTKYALLISADQTPTILMEYDFPKVAQWANDGAMAEIDLDEFAKVAPTYYNKMVENDQLQYTDLNGSTYFVLSERAYNETPYTFCTFVRKDWLDQVGKEIPTSYEEYCDCLDAIIDAGLVSKEAVATSLPTAAYVANFPFRDYPVDEKEWAQYSSLGTPCFTWEATKNMIKRANDEYHKGYTSKEFDLQTDDDAKSAFVNGQSFSYGNYMSASVDWLTSFYENNPDAELAIASNYAADEDGVAQATLRADNPFGMIVGFSSDATEDELKAAWMYMEWMSQDDVLFTLENGIEGVTYKMVDGIPEVDAAYRGEEMLNHNCNIDMTCIVHASKTIGDSIEDAIKTISPKGLPQDFTQDIIDNYYELKEIADSGKAYTDPIFTVVINSESEYNATLLSLYQEYYADLVKCAPEEFDALYEKYSKEYLEAGYQEIIDERLEAYENGNVANKPN